MSVPAVNAVPLPTLASTSLPALTTEIPAPTDTTPTAPVPAILETSVWFTASTSMLPPLSIRDSLPTAARVSASVGVDAPDLRCRDRPDRSGVRDAVDWAVCVSPIWSRIGLTR